MSPPFDDTSHLLSTSGVQLKPHTQTDHTESSDALLHPLLAHVLTLLTFVYIQVLQQLQSYQFTYLPTPHMASRFLLRKPNPSHSWCVCFPSSVMDSTLGPSLLGLSFWLLSLSFPKGPLASAYISPPEFGAHTLNPPPPVSEAHSLVNGWLVGVQGLLNGAT